MNNQLHISKGQDLTNFLRELKIEGEILTWDELLCEGPVVASIDSKEFIETRRLFLNDFYAIEFDEAAFTSELSKLNSKSGYTEIVLWFEYELFCHINMLAVLNLIHQREINLPIYLVCSGRVKGEKDLKGLNELSSKQLLAHYKDKIRLTEEDLELAITLWRTYCGKDHNLFKNYIVKKSSFKYMSNCLKAHLKRFPDSISGLSVIERNMLTIIDQKKVKSKHHLLGYSIYYQGYYGFSDFQLKRKIDNLALLYDETETGLKLNSKGHAALLGQHNFAFEINNNMTFGGIERLDYQFNEEKNELIKINLNAD
jgi:hypothetical protein